MVVSKQGRARQAAAQNPVLFTCRCLSTSFLWFGFGRAINKDFHFGNFLQHIISGNKLVKINSYLSRLNGLVTSGGDQSLFMRRDFFEKLGGFRDELIIMEDYDLVKRARGQGRYTRIPKALRVLDRKCRYNSFLRVNFSNAVIFSLYRLGVHPNKLYPIYKSWIKGPRYRALGADKD